MDNKEKITAEQLCEAANKLPQAAQYQLLIKAIDMLEDAAKTQQSA